MAKYTKEQTYLLASLDIAAFYSLLSTTFKIKKNLCIENIPDQYIIHNILVFHLIGPVDWDYRIHQLLLYRMVRPTP